MSSVVVKAVRVSDIIRMSVVDEALYFFAVSFLILAFVFVIDLGFDIEESSSAVSLALLGTTLGSVSAKANCLAVTYEEW